MSSSPAFTPVAASVDGYSTCPFCEAEVALVSLGRFKLSWHRDDAASLRCRSRQEDAMRASGIEPWIYDARMFR